MFKSRFFVAAATLALALNVACADDDTTSDDTGSDDPIVCGNNEKEAGEVCDGTDLDEQSCITKGFDRGSLRCNVDCLTFNMTSCENDPSPSVCGNDIIEGNELCDGTAEIAEDCEYLDYGAGELGCAINCLRYTYSDCADDPGIPDEWVCDESYQGDSDCDCGCGVADSMCAEGEGCTEPGCQDTSCDFCWDGTDSIVCDDSVIWNCQGALYDDGYGCDCGCGSIDLDCNVDEGCSENGCSAVGCDSCYTDGDQTVCNN